MTRPAATLIAGALVLLGAACAGDAGEQADPLATTRGDPRRGEAAIASYGCGSCHRIPGVPRARGLVGPPLTDFARRSYIAGSLPNTAENLQRWIRHPDSIRPGTVMPTLGVSGSEARDISAYLYLETGEEPGPPRLLPEAWLGAE
ncbi:MAG TPA: hypothetical protein VMN37_01435 [Gemmatimonadales bacterium]|nr:hypothetical protein [Gemmatimonadales bacterium]